MRPFMILMLASAAASPAEARETLGWYGHWGAFRDAPDRCFARAAPSSGGGGLAISTVPGAGVRVQVHVALPRPAREVGLTVSGRRFALIVAGLDAWPATPRVDLMVLAALRGGGNAELRGIDRQGGRFRATFPLVGGASAIDAALIGCLPRHAGK